MTCLGGVGSVSLARLQGRCWSGPWSSKGQTGPADLLRESAPAGSGGGGFGSPPWRPPPPAGGCQAIPTLATEVALLRVGGSRGRERQEARTRWPRGG